MLTRDSRIGEIYATPIGHDIIHTLLLQTGLPEKAVANPVVRRLSLRALQKLAPGRLDDSLVDSLLGLLNHETQTPPAPTGGITRKWWKEAVAYQIYPRSFADSNGDGVGDLRGIREKLPYLKELGVNLLWLSPVYDSPNDDNGYDIRDYRKIMAEFGTMEDFDALLAEAHANGMKLIMDLVVNHTSDEHPWFQSSLRDPDGPCRDYYIWHKGRDGKEPNNWVSFFSGPAWNYYPERDEWALHLFSKKQMDLNWDNPALRREVYDMIDWWLAKGVDGFRMDVIDMIAKPEEALASDGGPHRNVSSGPKEHLYLREMNREVLSRYDTMTVGETSSATVESAADYANLDGSELSMIFQFQHVSVDEAPKYKWCTDPLHLPKLKCVFDKWETGLYGKAWNSLYWNNHDQPRIVSRFGCDSDEASRVRSAKMLGACLHMMQGTPYIYQGEELGMTNYPMKSIDESLDVESINAYHELVEEKHEMTPEQMMACIRRKGRDNARTPMQWTAEKNAGFTQGKPWMPVNPNHTVINAQAQVGDPDSVFSFYQKLIRIRQEYDVVIDGRFELLMPEHEQVFAYIRDDGKQRMLVICNFSDRDAVLTADAQMEGQILLGNYDEEGEKQKLRPWETRIVILKE